MKRILVIIISVALLMSSPIQTDAVERIPLSEMSESECIEFIKQHDVEIPTDYDETTWAPFVKRIIEIVENDPDYEFAFNYTVTLAFANAIKNVVNTYYGITNSTTSQCSENATALSTYYTLQDSVAVGPWMTTHSDFNCYIYAIGTPEIIYKNPGVFSGKEFSLTLGILDIAELAIADLEALEHERVYQTSVSIDATNLCVNEQIICVRRGDYDYHFMRLEEGEWYHKPANSAILKYIRAMSVMRVWNNERMLSAGAVEPTTTYDSVIIFISYDGHDWDYAKNYNGTHTKSCDICGDVFVKDCDLEYTYTSLNCHKSVCEDCGHTVTGIACDFAYTYTGDGNSTHTHSGTCQDCGHVSTGICSFAYSYCGAPDGTHQHISTCTVCGETKGTAAACTYLAGSSNCRICGHNKNAIVTALGLSEDTFNYVNE